MTQSVYLLEELFPNDDTPLNLARSFRVGRFPTTNRRRTPSLIGCPKSAFEWSSSSSFLHHGIEEVERHLLGKFYKKIRRKSWSNVPPKLLACIRFLYKVVHKIGRLRKFNRSREIEFNFLTAWTISMKFGTLVQNTPGYKTCLRFFNFCLGT